jgi:uncharacterized protein
MTIVPIYAGIFAFIYIDLSLRVIRQRRIARVALGSGGDAALERAQRVHGNFSEYVPFALILLLLVEMQGWPGWLVHLLCVALLAGRLIHAVGVSQPKENFNLRIVGMTTTVGVIGAAGAVLLFGGLARAFLY